MSPNNALQRTGTGVPVLLVCHALLRRCLSLSLDSLGDKELGAATASGTGMVPQRCYDAVAEELARHEMIPGLWARAFSDACGNDPQARAVYIRLRASQLYEADRGHDRTLTQKRWSIFTHYGRVAYALTLVSMGISYSVIAGLFPDSGIRSLPLWCLLLPYIIPAIFRLRDTGNPEWVAFLIPVPICGLIVNLYLLFARGGYTALHITDAPPVEPTESDADTSSLNAEQSPESTQVPNDISTPLGCLLILLGVIVVMTIYTVLLKSFA